jgi:glycosidase
MPTALDLLAQPRPDSIRAVALPDGGDYFPSPADWRDEVLYFFLPDRFSDGREHERPLLDRLGLAAARRRDGCAWNWEEWVRSGATRWQGGTLAGAISRLDYLQRLGVTALWVGPVFKQRLFGNTYHGYGIQDFLDVDPRLGTRQDLVELVRAAHERGMRVLLDIIFNHSGMNWVYHADTPGGIWQPHYCSHPRRHRFGAWLDASNQPIAEITHPDAGVWPREFQHPDCYTRAGSGGLDDNDIENPHAEHKRTDFRSLRDFDLDYPGVLDDLVRSYQYWIALSDCDGFRIDTLKHVSIAAARRFCAQVKEYAARLGKESFLLIGEVGGGDRNQRKYLELLDPHLDAVLDIGSMRPLLPQVAKGLTPGHELFKRFGRADRMAGFRAKGNRHVSIINDHDHVFGEKLRFAVDAASDHQVVAAVALQLLALGLPCFYMGMEQALSGPEREERRHLPARWPWGRADVYLREAMFGPEQPRGHDAASLHEYDASLPGFGPCGTCGHHCFDEAHPAYRRIALLTRVRSEHAVLRRGKQYPREVSIKGGPFKLEHGPGEILAWSRILDRVEAVCIVNTHGKRRRGGYVLVDRRLSRPGSSLLVAVSTAAVDPGYTGNYQVGAHVEVHQQKGGPAFVDVRDLPPSEVLVLVNRVD